MSKVEAEATTSTVNHETAMMDEPSYKVGTVRDQEDMRRVGKMQELRRNFRLLSVLGFTAVLMCTWEAILFTASYILPNGGLAGMVWMYVVSLTGFSFAILSMAEMASMAPTSGGQYHWVSEFAPKSAQKFLSFVTGWLCVLGWQVNIASGSYLVALQLQGIIVLNNEGYVAQPWHATLMIIAVAIIAICFNTFFAKKLPLIEGLILIIHIFGFFGILIPLWALSPRAPAKEVFTEFTNVNGWPTQGLACLVGIIGPMYSLIGPDSAVHISEEIKDASRVLPLGMVWTLILNGVTGFVMVITFAFCLGDLTAAINPQYGFAYIGVFFNATQSVAATSVMTALITLMCLCSTISNVATASRQLWSFARDRGMPFSDFLCHVRPGIDIPLNAVLVSFVVTCLLSLINLGSVTAFNAIVSLTVGAILSSYIISIGCVALRKWRRQPLPRARWSLGRAGLPINIAAVMFLLVVYVFSFFPLLTPVPLDYMNWSSLIYGFFVLFSIAYYFIWGRKVYDGPVVLVNKEY
nr:putative amino-acid permease pb24d3.02c [Quercus suber]